MHNNNMHMHMHMHMHMCMHMQHALPAPVIASKPLFVGCAWRERAHNSPCVAWLIRSYPTLFTLAPADPSPETPMTPRNYTREETDVFVWNWAANVSRGRRLKTASGEWAIFWFNQTRKAHALARAWAEVMMA